MAAKIISGTEVAKGDSGRIKEGSCNPEREKRSNPGLVTILVGEDPASISYVTAKQRSQRP